MRSAFPSVAAVADKKVDAERLDSDQAEQSRQRRKRPSNLFGDRNRMAEDKDVVMTRAYELRISRSKPNFIPNA